MKKLLMLLIGFNSLLLSGQTTNQPAPTTEEEYNYLTKGYKVQIESGLDMKKGYEIVSIDTVSSKIASAELKVLYRMKDSKKEKAAYLIIYKRENRATEYICVPNPRSDRELIQRYSTALWDGISETSSKGQLISFLMSRHLEW